MESKSQFFIINQDAEKTIKQFTECMANNNIVFAKSAVTMVSQCDFVLFGHNENQNDLPDDTLRFGNETWQLAPVDEQNPIAQLYVPKSNPLTKLAADIIHADNDDLTDILKDRYDAIWKISFRWIDDKQVSVAMYEISVTEKIDRNQIVLRQSVDRFLASLRKDNLITEVHKDDTNLTTNWEFLPTGDSYSTTGRGFADDIDNVYEIIDAIQRFWQTKHDDDIFAQIADVASLIDDTCTDQRMCIVVVGDGVGTWLRKYDKTGQDGLVIYDYWYTTENGRKDKFVVRRYFNSSESPYCQQAETIHNEFTEFLANDRCLRQRGQYGAYHTTLDKYEQLLEIRQKSISQDRVNLAWTLACRQVGLKPSRVKTRFPELRRMWNDASYQPTLDDLLKEYPQ